MKIQDVLSHSMQILINGDDLRDVRAQGSELFVPIDGLRVNSKDGRLAILIRHRSR